MTLHSPDCACYLWDWLCAQWGGLPCLRETISQLLAGGGAPGGGIDGDGIDGGGIDGGGIDGGGIDGGGIDGGGIDGGGVDGGGMGVVAAAGGGVLGGGMGIAAAAACVGRPGLGMRIVVTAGGRGGSNATSKRGSAAYWLCPPGPG